LLDFNRIRIELIFFSHEQIACSLEDATVITFPHFSTLFLGKTTVSPVEILGKISKTYFESEVLSISDIYSILDTMPGIEIHARSAQNFTHGIS